MQRVCSRRQRAPRPACALLVVGAATAKLAAPAAVCALALRKGRYAAGCLDGAVRIYGGGDVATWAGCPAPVQAKARAALGGKNRVVDGDISPSLSAPAASFIRRLLRKDPAERPSASEALRDPFLCDAWRHSTDERWEAKASERLNVDCSDLEFEATTPRQTVCIRDGVARIAWLLSLIHI